MWTNKYKPTEYSEFIGNTEIIHRLDSLSKRGIYQHLIVCGHGGTGKTTAINILIHKLLGDKMSQALLKITSLDTHDIQTIREKIHQFAPKKVILDNGTKIKIILFENVDNTLSEGTQQVMRRLMEQFIHNTIFIFICKDSSKLIESIHSRCQTIRFSPITEYEQIQHYKNICEKESISFEEDALQWIAKLSNGDIRTGINYLQAFSYKNIISIKDIKSEAIFPYIQEIEICVQHIIDKNLKQSLVIPTELYKKGFSSLDIIMFIGNVIRFMNIQQNVKIITMKNITITYKKINEGIDSILQVYNMISQIIKEL